jgi:hypothetical protein
LNKILYYLKMYMSLNEEPYTTQVRESKGPGFGTNAREGGGCERERGRKRECEQECKCKRECKQEHRRNREGNAQMQTWESRDREGRASDVAVNTNANADVREGAKEGRP